MPRPLITFDPKVMMGKPVIAGTRITVELVLVTADGAVQPAAAISPDASTCIMLARLIRTGLAHAISPDWPFVLHNMQLCYGETRRR